MNIKLELTLDEVNKVLTALGRSYLYIDIVTTIDKIKEQTVPQIPPPEEAAPQP